MWFAFWLAFWQPRELAILPHGLVHELARPDHLIPGRGRELLHNPVVQPYQTERVSARHCRQAE